VVDYCTRCGQSDNKNIINILTIWKQQD
jgi:hypothetical protein